MMKHMKIILLITAIALAFTACKHEEKIDFDPEVPDLADGSMVIYEPKEDEPKEPEAPENSDENGQEEDTDTENTDVTVTPEPDDGKIYISMVGDCTLASSQRDNMFEQVVGDNYAWPFEQVVDIFEKDDFTIVNLESSFSDQTLYGSGTFNFYAPTKYAKILTEGDVELATMGNNHTDEFGEKGVADTQAALDAESISHLYADTSRIYEIDGMKLGVYVSPFFGNTKTVSNGVKDIKAQGADIVIACIHWGLEGRYNPTSSQITVGRAAIDAGADIVCGSHPHVLQPMEEYNGGYIMYSLGNFSFGGNTNPRDKDSAIAQAVIEQVDGTYKVTGIEFIPCSITSESNKNNFQPVPLEKNSEAYTRVMSKLDGTFDGPDLVVDYSAFATPTPVPEVPSAPEVTPVPAPPEPPAEPETPAPEPVPPPTVTENPAPPPAEPEVPPAA